LAEALTDCGFDVTFVAGPAELELLGEHAGQEAWISPRSPSDLARRLLAANLYVGNDSGVTHLAGLLGVPTVALFGPTHPLTWSPLGPRVRVIRACMVEPGREVRVCRDDDCMGAIRVEDVLDVCRAPFVPATAIL
jgi:ADP-heptose:LPS heptosyltransferase